MRIFWGRPRKNPIVGPILSVALTTASSGVYSLGALVSLYVVYSLQRATSCRSQRILYMPVVTRNNYRQCTLYLHLEEHQDLQCAYRYDRHFIAHCRCFAETLRHIRLYRHLPIESSQLLAVFVGNHQLGRLSSTSLRPRKTRQTLYSPNTSVHRRRTVLQMFRAEE